MKRFILRFLCVFCAAVISISFLPLLYPVSADEPVGKMASVYGYALNDYIEAYGVISTDNNAAVRDSWGAYENPSGVIYADIMNFDNSECPYLVIFSANGGKRTVFCDILHYSDELESTVKIASIARNMDDFTGSLTGEFNMAWSGGRQYITFRTFENGAPVKEEFYTLIDGDAFIHVTNPSGAVRSGIADFSASYLHPGINVSYYNEALNDFFDKLKDTAAESVTHENLLPRLSDEDKKSLNQALISASIYADFDIMRFNTPAEYLNALTKTSSEARFTQLTAIYNLGEGIYYARFDTDFSKYNYALLRKSDKAENGYQLLKVRMDCIPLADRELKRIKAEYVRCPLLYEKSGKGLKLSFSVSDAIESSDTPVTPITVKVGDNDPVTVPAATKSPDNALFIKKRFSFGKIIDERVKLPAVCIGGGISAGLLTILWVYLYSDDEEQ